eukprot:c18896_g1_i3.p2 GENE.c18896_g1_i3~~c18896_g1_i3.p2  ORF type:complete len:227 (+),score=31.49 c18896_g1_i3:1060-1740(+)
MRNVENLKAPAPSKPWTSKIGVPPIDFGTGGWNSTKISSDSGCSFDVVQGANLSPEQFLSSYVIPGRPILIKQSLPNFFWTKSEVSELLSGRSFNVGVIPYAEWHGNLENLTSVSFEEYRTLAKKASLGSVVPYIFEAFVNWRTEPLLTNAILVPPHMLAATHCSRSSGSCTISEGGAEFTEYQKSLISVVQFYFGAANSGANGHFHSDAWNFLAFGLKRLPLESN